MVASSDVAYMLLGYTMHTRISRAVGSPSLKELSHVL